MDKLARLLLGLTVGAWIARYLGPHQFGELAYVLVVIAFFQAVASLGLDSITVRELATKRWLPGQILGTALTLRLSVGLLAWIIAVCAMAVHEGIDSRAVILAALVGSTLILQPAEAIDLWFQSESQSRRAVKVKLIAYFITHSVKGVLIISEAPIEAFAAAVAFDAMASALMLTMAYRRYPGAGKWSFSSTLAKRLLLESWPLIIAAVSVMIYMRIDQVMIRAVLGGRELGVYAAVLPLATLWSVIPMTLNASLAPFVSRKKQESEGSYKLALSQIFRAYAAIGWISTLLAALLAYPMVHLLFGPEYTEGIAPVSLYAATNIFICMGTAQTLWIINEMRPKISLYKSLVGCVACLLLNSWLIPRHGLMGAAMSAVIAQFISTIGCNVFIAPEILRLQLRGLLLLSPSR